MTKAKGRKSRWTVPLTVPHLISRHQSDSALFLTWYPDISQTLHCSSPDIHTSVRLCTDILRMFPWLQCPRLQACSWLWRSKAFNLKYSWCVVFLPNKKVLFITNLWYGIWQKLQKNCHAWYVMALQSFWNGLEILVKAGSLVSFTILCNNPERYKMISFRKSC